jgi:hypothetical protein
VVELVLGSFVVAHGLVTAGIWLAPGNDDAPFDPAHSWLLGEARRAAIVIGFLVGAGLVVAGLAMLTRSDWWPTAAMLAGAGGTVQILVWFNRWLVLGLAINLAVLAVGLGAGLD